MSGGILFGTTKGFCEIPFWLQVMMQKVAQNDHFGLVEKGGHMTTF
jgi:hypothetical protein